MALDLPDWAVVPIHKQQLISQGGIAKVWETLILEEFIAPNLRQACGQSSVKSEDIGRVSDRQTQSSNSKREILHLNSATDLPSSLLPQNHANSTRAKSSHSLRSGKTAF